MSGTLASDTTAQVSDRAEEWLLRTSTKPRFTYGRDGAGLDRHLGTYVLNLGRSQPHNELDQEEDQLTECPCGYVFDPDESEFRLCRPGQRLVTAERNLPRPLKRVHWDSDHNEPGSGRELDLGSGSNMTDHEREICDSTICPECERVRDWGPILELLKLNPLPLPRSGA